MRTCEIQVDHGQSVRWIRAYRDARRGPLCIDCTVKLHPEIRLNPRGARHVSCDPVYEDNSEAMFELYEARCRGPGLPHAVLCDARTEIRRAQEAQLDFGPGFGRRRP